MSRTNRSSCARLTAASLASLGCLAVLLLAASSSATQSRIIPPQPPANSNTTAKRSRVATLRANDSTEGSRATLTANQSLTDYEAYRRGDRFYVKIPAADVPRPEAVRGRAFADVKVQRASDSTVVSFRLQPGATARVEQRGNKLDVVFTMPGARPSTSSSSRDVARNDAGPAPPQDSKRRSGSNSNTSPALNSNRSANRNSADRAAARPTPTPKPSPSPKASASPSPKASVSPSVKSSPVVAQQRSSPSPSSTTNASQASSGFSWANFKQRVRYWILLAQLNPIPVAIGAAVLLFFIGLLIFQRRRARATRRIRTRKAAMKATPAVATTASSAAAEPVQPAAEAATIEPIDASAAIAGAGVASAALASEQPNEAAAPDERSQRVARVSDEMKRLMAGGDYDESILASDDRDTRQLVGAELLSALVGRNLQRRERARAAFMKHGYFDDATRDLRIADSPNERAAAARRLSFVHEREATPHLIAALDDSSPDVRRAAVEALMDLRDPAAIAPLNSLMQTENDRKVPRNLIKHAIEACATGGSDESVTMPALSSLPHPAAPSTAPADIEREVIEI